MSFKSKWVVVGCVLIVTSMFLAGGCALNRKAGTSGKQAVVPYDVNVCPTAKITKVNYFIKKYKGSPRFHVAVGIKNLSTQPKRFRLHIFLPDGVSSGGLYPRKGKPPVIMPGKELVQTYPMYYSKLPAKFELVVTELPLK